MARAELLSVMGHYVITTKHCTLCVFWKINATWETLGTIGNCSAFVHRHFLLKEHANKITKYFIK